MFAPPFAPNTGPLADAGDTGWAAVAATWLVDDEVVAAGWCVWGVVFRCFGAILFPSSLFLGGLFLGVVLDCNWRFNSEPVMVLAVVVVVAVCRSRG